MRNLTFNGGPDISGKSTQAALEILAQNCRDTGQIVFALNKEIEELKDEIEQLKMRIR
ncbi:hypothetical protein [Janthinobacterium sp. HLS12-2]|uniref:hypothetical protein n=1 Tax=Janthinobacterium sp. HLS12-2 TaxID=1259324 RepID=UPI003F1FA97B